MIPGVFAASATADRGWTPAVLSPSIWCDDSTNVSDVSGFASAWANKGSIGGSFTQSIAMSRFEILPAELNGRRVLRADGSNDAMFIESAGAGDLFRSVGQGWIFSVFRKRGTDVAPTNRAVVYAPVASGQSRLYQSCGGGQGANVNYMATRRTDGQSTAALAGSATPGQWISRLDAMNWATGAGAIYINGTLDAQNPSLTSTGNTSSTAGMNNRISIAATAVETSAGIWTNYADIDLACVIMGSGSLPDSDERSSLFDWAASRYDL